MIEQRDDLFLLTTDHTSYWFAVTAHGHLEHIHFGPRLPAQDADALRWKRTVLGGSSVVYDPADPHYCLDLLPLEFSGIGQGDYRHPPLVISTAGTGYDLDLTYRGHRITPGPATALTLPVADGDAGSCDTLAIDLADDRAGIAVQLEYTVYPQSDAIVRRTIVRNTGTQPAVIEEVASAQIDLPDRGWEVETFDGAWIAETHAHRRPVSPGIIVNGSTTGSSSNRHNPGFLLRERGSAETHGRVYGVNLIYSGSHRSQIEDDGHGLIRVTTGIQPQGFAWPLEPGESFDTPQAVLSFSATGASDLSDRMHRFVNAHIVPAGFRDVPRPVVFNSWEAVSFDVNERRLGKLAGQAAALGVEMFVIDDGWFIGRSDDTGGLGDYTVDAAKFPSGLRAFGERVKSKGMRLGLWVEPEMVNERSELYRRHPEWAMRVPGKPPREGRNQQVLDLCDPEVCDYIVESVGAVLDSADITYVKWDMNRHIADAYSPHVPHQGMVAHTYMRNLYGILDRIFAPRPHILLEMCSSGGNRFDLGMLRFAAMIWASDDTDPIERLEIQQGLTHLYPPSVISAHVSAAPHAQTLRDTPLSTRFNVAAFGCLGYEYDLDLTSREERREITEQIAFYKQHRHTLQFGRFRRHDQSSPDRFVWQSGDADTVLIGNFQRRVDAASAPQLLPVLGLDDDRAYVVRAKPQRLMIQRFGPLINHVTPVRLDPRGMIITTVSRFHSLRDAAEEYRGTGGLLAEGIRLQQQFQGTEYNEQVRMLGDGGSTLYVITADGAEGAGHELPEEDA